jgi:hypothetical protein
MLLTLTTTHQPATDLGQLTHASPHPWRQDYQAMRSEMFFGDVPKFDEILRVVGEFEKRFNQSSAV